MTFHKSPLLLLSVLSFSILHAQEDTTANETYISSFFKRCEKITLPGKTFIVTKAGKYMTLTNFLQPLKNPEDSIFPSVEYGLADLDNDKKKELVIFNYTGGAHCCDEIYFFKNIGPNKYQYVTKTFAGNVYIDVNNNILYDFYEQFGYFFTCYACEYGDSSVTKTAPIHSIELRYQPGKLVVENGGPEMLNAIRNRLAGLSRVTYQKLDSEIDQDDGLRKEFALTLAVYYYSFGKRNVASTKLLFDKYYRYPDAKKVWAAFVKQLQFIRQNNGF
jgi:hypothetical protein